MTHRYFAKYIRPSFAAAIFCVMICGCTSRPSFVRSANADPALRKSNAEFAADAGHRQYEANAPRAGAANGGAEIDYGFHYLSLVNSSSQDWINVEIWVNQKYVIMIPKISANAARAEIVSFDMIYDSHGASFPTDSQKTPITSVEMYGDGKMFTLMTQLAD
jgi:hypothetical protein